MFGLQNIFFGSLTVTVVLSTVCCFHQQSKLHHILISSGRALQPGFYHYITISLIFTYMACMRVVPFIRSYE